MKRSSGTRLFILLVLTILPCMLAAQAPEFVMSPADPDDVAVVIPRGSVSPPSGHIRPVKHMYMQYVTPRGGGAQTVNLQAMAPGQIVAVFQRQADACFIPEGGGCSAAPGSHGLIDEYQLWIRHMNGVTSYYDHVHELDARLGLPSYGTLNSGWVAFGPGRLLFLGFNGAIPPVRVFPGQRLGATRNYFSTWDIGVVDTARIGMFLGSGPLRYPRLSDFVTAYNLEFGASLQPTTTDEPFPGEMSVNSSCFIDYMIPPLESIWRAKLIGDGSCGRPDWDYANTLSGNWFDASVTGPTLTNLSSIDDNAMSFSPFNLDPVHKVQIGVGANFVASAPSSVPDILKAEASLRLSQPLQFIPNLAADAKLNPEPTLVTSGRYACYEIPPVSAGGGNALLVYHVLVGGLEHVKARYIGTECTSVLAALASDPTLLESRPWWVDYVR